MHCWPPSNCRPSPRIGFPQVILLLDVDFWPSSELSELMHQPGKYESLLAVVEQRHAIVLPAFETGDSGEVGVEVAREVVVGECEGVGSFRTLYPCMCPGGCMFA
jgi:hypothetical protein